VIDGILTVHGMVAAKGRIEVTTGDVVRSQHGCPRFLFLSAWGCNERRVVRFPGRSVLRLRLSPFCHADLMVHLAGTVNHSSIILGQDLPTIL
jgi:hypothetical protein